MLMIQVRCLNHIGILSCLCVCLPLLMQKIVMDEESIVIFWKLNKGVHTKPKNPFHRKEEKERDTM
jgi:hypothetical protein